jgi:hypothetical protein
MFVAAYVMPAAGCKMLVAAYTAPVPLQHMVCKKTYSAPKFGPFPIRITEALLDYFDFLLQFLILVSIDLFGLFVHIKC